MPFRHMLTSTHTHIRMQWHRHKCACMLTPTLALTSYLASTQAAKAFKVSIYMVQL